jgi:hypothetical protein
MRLRLMASTGVAIAAAVIAAGCGASADLSSVAKAAEKTNDVKTSAFSLVLELSGEGSYAGEGAADLAAHNGHITLHHGSKLVYEAIWNGPSVYLHSPDLPVDGLTHGKPWIKMPASGDFADFANLALFDPVRLFGLLRDAGHFEATGTEDVREVPTTRYEGAVVLKKFQEQFAPNSPDDLPDDLAAKTFPVKAWVDRDGYLRKVALDLPSLGTDAPGGRMEIELYDFGAPVDATPPPSDQVGEMSASPPSGAAGTYTATLQVETTGG